METIPTSVPKITILGVPVHMVQRADAVSLIEHWVKTESDRCHWIAAPDMHGVVFTHKDPTFKAILRTADLVIPDGITLVWIARHKGFPLKQRVSGTDLMREFFRSACETGLRSFFYGDTEETLERLVANLRREFPRLQIAGCLSPPFRPLTPQEDEEVIAKINEAKPDVLWVGLGLPKQERWIFEHRDKLRVPVVAGVGAAFKFLAGTVKRAPAWVGDHGFEWLWRLVHEPRRMWRRSLIGGTQFLGHAVLELTGLRKYH